MDKKQTLAAGYAIEKLAEILNMIKHDMESPEYQTPDGRSRVIQNGVHSAIKYFHKDFGNVLEDAELALQNYLETL